MFDGDNLRQGLCADLELSEEDRNQNIRRVEEMVNIWQLRPRKTNQARMDMR